MPSQTEAGKAFEFALFTEANNYLSGSHKVLAKNDNPFSIAENCFRLFNSSTQSNYLSAARSAIAHIAEIEPRLENPVSEKAARSRSVSPRSSSTFGAACATQPMRRSPSFSPRAQPRGPSSCR